MDQPSKHDIFKTGEDLATKYLISNGYRLVCRNFRTRSGEIDIIVETDQHLIFVEVKTRTFHSIETALASVSYTKQKKISKTAQEYINLNEQYGNHIFRFDVIVVFRNASTNTYSIHHLEDAFYPIIDE
ncbi:MAG: YraN family protein [Candidatus Cloacimonetes bacterium]|nr:YraN family protein [Candidatus Cloacimonadota bacterium]MDD3234822.1 YraN family protein [Candidatus Cloacimonadota bacterium]